jgi:ubiquinone/menaquinone biosynthesis C-methylase UbiE
MHLDAPAELQMGKKGIWAIEENVRSSRGRRTIAWAVAALFVVGFFVQAVGLWTGPILGVWFVGTQKTKRGFVWMAAFAFLFSLRETWHTFSMTVLARGAGQTPRFLGLVVVAILLSVLPFTFHRLVSPRLPGFLSTLAFPVGAIALTAAASSLHFDKAGTGNNTETFVVCWFAAAVVWVWDQEGNSALVGPVFVVFILLIVGWNLAGHLSSTVLLWMTRSNGVIDVACMAGAVVLSGLASMRTVQFPSWMKRAETVDLLRSPVTGHCLRVETDGELETLVSEAGEQFPIRRGIPDFRQPGDLSGDNGKYNHLYETIGGFYDDTQRVFCALKGFDRDAYFRSYMNRLEVKPGDSVLETSVGTGLNYKYLPRGVKLSGLDLSPEMLATGQGNLQRWKLDADLYLGNAEEFPFADASFDVVFHVGGINFFNNRLKAIQEMIRVAKPGSLLMISDETEKHVKEVYERQPGSKFRNRREPVTPPVDLVPADMEDVHLEVMRSGEWYVLTFRKPSVNRSIDAQRPAVTAANPVPVRA